MSTENKDTVPGSEDARIEQEINAALRAHPRIDETDMLVEVNNAEVTLKGKADTEEEKELAQLLAAAVAGVRHVDNRLHVDIGIAHTLSVIATQMSADTEKPPSDEEKK